MEVKISKTDGYEYIEHGKGTDIIILHGLFGTITQWTHTVKHFAPNYRVLVPLLPIYKKSKYKASIFGLSDFVVDFMEYKNVKNCFLIGNSLGGHVALILSLKFPDKFKALILSGSSGLTKPGKEEEKIFFKRRDKKFIREKVELTFYDRKMADEELISKVYKIINNNRRALRILSFGKSGTLHSMSDKLNKITLSTLLIWGADDKITSSAIAHQFNELLPNSKLVFIDQCGHAPMMEKPNEFNTIIDDFLASQCKINADRSQSTVL